MNPSRKVTQLGREREGEREGGRERGRGGKREKGMVERTRSGEEGSAGRERIRNDDREEKRGEEVVDKVRCAVYRKRLERIGLRFYRLCTARLHD